MVTIEMTNDPDCSRSSRDDGDDMIEAIARWRMDKIIPRLRSLGIGRLLQCPPSVTAGDGLAGSPRRERSEKDALLGFAQGFPFYSGILGSDREACPREKL